MKTIAIPKKKKGEFRTIYMPTPTEKFALQEYLSKLEKTISSFEKNGKIDSKVIQGFRLNKSPVTNAWQHVGYAYTLSMDLADFFDTVKPEHVEKYISKEIIEKAFVDGAPRQGLPTSPAIANLAAIAIDKAILKFLDKKKLNVVYTRYADDLTFSFNDKELKQTIVNQVKNTATRIGFKINDRKTRLQAASFGLREVTGVMVGNDSVSVSRNFKRKMRAAKHKKTKSLIGLQEWSKLKIPSQKETKTQRHTLNTLIQTKRIPNKFKSKKEYYLKEIREGNLLITNDLGYIMGMSDLGDGWTSCYRRLGLNKNAPLFLSQFNVSVGVYLGNETKYYGLKRHLLKARCIIYHATNGKSYARSFYGHQPYVNELKNFIRKNNIYTMNTSSIGYAKVDGYGKPMFSAVMYNGVRKSTVKLKGREGKFCKLSVRF